MLLSYFKNSCLVIAFAGITGFTTVTKSPITITILSPAENSSVKMGDTVFIQARMSSDEPLHDVSIKVKTADNTIIAYAENIHTHDNQLDISKNYIQTIKYKTELILEISSKDHSGNIVASSSRKFFSNKK